MGISVYWWFYKVEETNFSILRSEFDRAAEGVPDLPDVPELAPRQKNTPVPVTKDYAISVLTSILAGRDLSWSFYHQAFESIAYRILQEEFFTMSSERFAEVASLSRVAPPAILLMGIGKERFSRLPGYLGNMLIHSSEVEQTISIPQFHSFHTTR